MRHLWQKCVTVLTKMWRLWQKCDSCDKNMTCLKSVTVVTKMWRVSKVWRLWKKYDGCDKSVTVVTEVLHLWQKCDSFDKKVKIVTKMWRMWHNFTLVTKMWRLWQNCFICDKSVTICKWKCNGCDICKSIKWDISCQFQTAWKCGKNSKFWYCAEITRPHIELLVVKTTQSSCRFT